jgi:Zn finger protein HypA/HybF involved in hydrogenase expression
MEELGNELDMLLNSYENKKIPKEVGSNDLTEESSSDLTEESSNITLEENLRPEDSISNNGKDTEYEDKIYKEGLEVYNIEGQIKILNGRVKELKINDKSKISEIIKCYNKELEIYNKMKEELRIKIENIDNKDYKAIISKYEKEKLDIIEKNKIEQEDLKRLYNNKEKYVEENIENKYKNKIEILEDNLLNVKSQIEREYKIRLEYEEARNKELEEYKKKLEKDKEHLINLTNKKAQTKGVEGELEIYNYLKSKIELNDNSKIENVSKDKKESSDLYLEHNKLKCVIEIKNHNSTIQKNDIKKFEEVYINQEKYNSGLFISLISDYSPSSGKKDFDLIFINEKPVIYLSSIEKNKDKIIIAIKMLNYILENKDDYNFDKILHLLKLQICNYSNLTKKLIDVNQIVNNIILETKQFKKQIEDIIEPENKKETECNEAYTILNNNLIQCNYCNQKPYDISKTKKYIIKHLLKSHNVEIEIEH